MRLACNITSDFLGRPVSESGTGNALHEGQRFERHVFYSEMMAEMIYESTNDSCGVD